MRTSAWQCAWASTPLASATSAPSACLRPGAAAGMACPLSSAAVTDLSMQSMTSKEFNLKVQAEDTVDHIGMVEIAKPGTDNDLITGNGVNNSRTPLDIA